MSRIDRPLGASHSALLAILAVTSLGVAARAQTGEAGGTSDEPAPDPGRESITVDDLRGHIEFLADDRLQGRAAGTKGNDRAAEYIADHFKKLRLEKVAERGRSWFQTFTAESARYKSVDTRNVLGLLEGSDPDLKDQIVVIGGHYDHVGVGRFGSREQGRSNLDDRIHNGADDNASGTAGVLELAEAFAENPTRRSLLFITFSAEELGLLGSKHYCEEPVLPLERTVAMFNFDMIGRSVEDYLFVGGVGTSPAWDDLIRDHLEDAGLRVERGAGGRAPSDNTPFYEKGLPVLFFFTNVHVDYHRVSDEARFINYGGEHRIVLATYDLIRELADRDEKPAFRKADGQGMPEEFRSLMNEPSRARDLAGMARSRARERIDRKGCGRLGFSPATAARGELMIGEVLAEGPAANAGLEAGDVILQVQGTDVRFSQDVAAAVKGVKAGEVVTMAVRDGDGSREVEVTIGR